MSHILKYTIWESCGRWHAGDVSDLKNGSNYWWHPMRMLELSPEEYIKLLIKYGATNFSYTAEKNVLLYHFNNRKDALSYSSFINKTAKNKNFTV
jgi:hypothetical protein